MPGPNRVSDKVDIRKTPERGSSRIKGAARRLSRDTRASVLPIMAAALIPTMAMIGSGIDFGRAYLAGSKLQGAVDAAALASVRAKQLSSNTIGASELIGEEYLRANFPQGYVGGTLKDQKVEVTAVNDTVKVEVVVSGTINTTLLSVIGIKTLPFSARATAEASETLPNSVEALLVLDNTGSMRGSRMAALKVAAKNFVGTIYGDKDHREGFAVGILPYNTMVNVGRLVRMQDASMVRAFPDYTDQPVSDPLAWKGCVFADETIRNISSDPHTMDVGAFDLGDNMPGDPGSAMPPLEPFIYPPIFVDSFQDVNNRYNVPAGRQRILDIPTVRNALTRLHGNDICVHKVSGNDRNCTQPNSRISIDRLPDEDEFEDARYYSHKSGESQSASPNNIWGASPNYQCPAEALPMNYAVTKSGLQSYIEDENYALRPGTGTFHNAAMTWAYRMMSRDDVFPRARPAGIPVKRVVIFMTDGNFDSRDDGRDGPGGTVLDTAYTAYRTYEDRVIIPTTDRDDTIDNLAFRFAKTCEAMKEDGIEIYTIAFELDNGTRGDATREMFRACATDQNTHFFAATNGAALNEAFVTIAAELVNLRLTS